MNFEIRSLAILSVATLVLIACGEQALEEGAASGMANMPSTPAAAEAPAEHAARGTLNSIDRAQGRVNISHEAVASAGWPAMTMSFKLADPSAVPELAPGQRIEFRFTTEGGGTVTAIEPAE